MREARSLHGGGSGAALEALADRAQSNPQQMRLIFWRQFNALTGGACANERGSPDPEKVKAWQAAHGLAADGIVGRLTLGAAKRLGAAGKATSVGESAGDAADHGDGEQGSDDSGGAKSEHSHDESKSSGGGSEQAGEEGHSTDGDVSVGELGGKPNYLVMFNHVMGKEGHLSRNPSDKAAKHPCPDEHDGKTGWHTNRGITWSTFQSSAVVIGYDPNDSELFFAMPDAIAQKIFKLLYWDGVHGDEYSSQVVANILTQWAWGSGLGGALTLLRSLIPVGSWAAAPAKLNQMVAEKGEREVFEALMNRRKDRLIELSEPGTGNEKFRDGWLKRHQSFYEMNEGLLK